MSASLQCLECGLVNEIDDGDIVLLAENPPDREAALSLSALMPLCAKCGQPLLGVARALYVDRDKSFAVRYVPPWREPRPFDPEDARYALRDVQSVLAFREKVFLLDRGLDDVVVELLKIVTIKANRDIAFSAIYCGDAQPDHLVMEALCEGREDFSYNIPMEAYENMARDLVAAKGETWRPEGFARVDRDWVTRNVLTPDK